MERRSRELTMKESRVFDCFNSFWETVMGYHICLDFGTCIDAWRIRLYQYARIVGTWYIIYDARAMSVCVRALRLRGGWYAVTYIHLRPTYSVSQNSYTPCHAHW